MADIELVIKLSEEEYKYIREMQFCILGIRNGKGLLNRVLHAIRTGTPLPKGHGKLIDADEQIFKIEEIYNGYMLSEDGGVVPNDFVEFLEEAPTIIEADKRDEG